MAAFGGWWGDDYWRRSSDGYSTWSTSTKITLGSSAPKEERDPPLRLTNDGGATFMNTTDMSDAERLEAYSLWAQKCSDIALGHMLGNAIDRGAKQLVGVLRLEIQLRYEKL